MGAVFYDKWIASRDWAHVYHLKSLLPQLLIAAAIASIFVEVWFTHLEKKDYQDLHCYVGALWIPFYVLLRNSHPKLIASVCPLFEFIGSHSLELYLLQFHIFLTRQSSMIMYVIPYESWSLLNMLCSSIIICVVAALAFKNTASLFCAVQTCSKKLVAGVAICTFASFFLLKEIGWLAIIIITSIAALLEFTAGSLDKRTKSQLSFQVRQEQEDKGDLEMFSGGGSILGLGVASIAKLGHWREKEIKGYRSKGRFFTSA